MPKKKFCIFFIFAKAFAVDSNILFKSFENQYNIAYGYSQGGLVNGMGNTSQYTTQSINLELEHLFDVGVWFDVNFSMLTANNQPNLGQLNGGNGSSTNNPATNLGAPFTANPFDFSFTTKVGYAFDVVNNKLQVIPYGMLGRNTNWSSSTVIANNGQNLVQDVFITGGVGGRLAYRINDVILLYMDQIILYNWDNSGAIKTTQVEFFTKSYAATNYGLTSTLGAKFNLYRSLQLGSSIYWNNYQPQSNISGLIYTPTNTFGGLVSIGLTY